MSIMTTIETHTRKSTDVNFYQVDQITADLRTQHSPNFTETISDSQDGLTRTIVHVWNSTDDFHAYTRQYRSGPDWGLMLDYCMTNDIKVEKSFTAS